MKRVISNTLHRTSIKAAFEQGTVFYKITEDQLKSFYNNSKNIVVRYLVDTYGFDAFSIDRLYGSIIADDGCLYLCHTDGQEIRIGSDTDADPESALEDYSLEDLASYIQDGNDDVIKRYLTEYELKPVNVDEEATDMIQKGLTFVEVLKGLYDADLIDIDEIV